MSEIEQGYTPEHFPYADILGRLTDKVRADHLLPAEAYVEFLQLQEGARLPHYFDFASTSVIAESQDRVLGREMHPAAESRTQAARTILSALATQGSIECNEIILSADLGGVGWTQVQYTTFWSLVLAGCDIRERSYGIPIEKDILQSLGDAGVRFEVIEHSLDPKEYVPEYDKFVDFFAQFLDDPNLSFAPPPHRVISLIDSKHSLEGRVERMLGSEFNIGMQRVAAITLPEDMGEDAPLVKLPSDIEVVTAYDERLRIAQAGACLILTGDKKPIVAS